ncbi:hypothetical protein [Scytonema sp. PRP1]|uniref:hypothetical protein n=1 Tax=Scytonema sp. PRP1 TaxID=3120513 RepID=UPI00300C3ACD
MQIYTVEVKPLNPLAQCQFTANATPRTGTPSPTASKAPLGGNVSTAVRYACVQEKNQKPRTEANGRTWS